MIRVVAIDGPSGSGKSTVARALAHALNLAVLNTGAMYRAVTLAALEAGVALDDAAAVSAVARRCRVEVGDRVLLDGRDVTREIRGPDVTGAVSTVSAHREVRAVLVERQRAWVAEHGGGVVEGRDIGTVVFPLAAVKVFLTARPEVRASRRQGDEESAERSVELADVHDDLERRDVLDSTRSESPLERAPDALLLDTSDLTVDQTVALVVQRFNQLTGAGA